MKNKKHFLKYLATTSLACCMGNIFAADRIAGAFLGATPPQLEAEGFERTLDNLPDPDTLHYTKLTNQKVLVQVFAGTMGQPDAAAHTLSVSKWFGPDDEETCRKFVYDLHGYLTSSEKKKMSPISPPPTIFRSFSKTFRKTLVNEAYQFDSGNRRIHFYCISINGPEGQKNRTEGFLELIDFNLSRRASSYLPQPKNEKNSLLEDLIE